MYGTAAASTSQRTTATGRKATTATAKVTAVAAWTSGALASSRFQSAWRHAAPRASASASAGTTRALLAPRAVRGAAPPVLAVRRRLDPALAEVPLLHQLEAGGAQQQREGLGVVHRLVARLGEEPGGAEQPRRGVGPADVGRAAVGDADPEHTARPQEPVRLAGELVAVLDRERLEDVLGENAVHPAT